MRILTSAAAVLACCLWQSCDIINPAETVPTYVQIDSFVMTTDNPTATGTVNQKILTAWIYFNNSPLGVYNIPGRIPIPTDKPGTVQIGAGITFNGLGDYQILYPFFTFDTMYLQPNPGKIVNYSPKIKYTEATTFPWKEDFETGNTFIKVNSDNTEDTSIVRTADKSKVFEGGGAGYIVLDSKHPSSQNINNTNIAIKTGDAYLEINYKCNTPFEVGLQTTKNGTLVYEYIAGVKPNENWNKFYVSLQKFVGTYNTNAYRVMIKTNLQEGQSEGYVLLDNLKIVSY